MLRNRFGNRPGAIPCVLAIWLLLQLVPSLIAQTAGMGVLTGRVVDSSGNPVANATVTVTSVDNGQARSATTGTDGSYRFDDLPPGNYRMKLEAAGFQTLEIPSATVDGTKPSVVDEKLQASAPTTIKPALEQQDNLPNAPSSSSAPSLSDLGLTPEQTQGNAREQALLDKRTHMLKIHQRMGLITTIPLIATVILGPGAGGKSEGTATRDLHVALGGADRRPVRHHRLLRHSRSQNPRNQKARSDKISRGDGVDTRPWHDRHAHPGNYGVRSEEQRRKSSWRRLRAWTSGHRDRWRVWGCSSFGFV